MRNLSAILATLALALLLAVPAHAEGPPSAGVPVRTEGPPGAVVTVRAERPPEAVAPARAASALSPEQQRYLTLAQAGVAQAERRWRDPRRGWYDARLNDGERYPLATIWDIVPLFESLDAIAIAQPSPANKSAVARFAAGAERYLNRGLRPLPGYSPYPGDREASTETWFDDNGWWGLAFVNAYRATGTRRYLTDAERALRYIAAAGWDAQGGGIWWNTHHPYKAGEALAAGTLLATLLYQQTHSAFALGQAHKFLAWANSSGFSAANGLYAASNVNPTPIDYIEGPLIYAQATLCRLTATPSQCERAETAEGESAHALRLPARLLAAVRRDLPAVDARAVRARRRPQPVRDGGGERPRRADPRTQRRRPVSALVERADTARDLRAAGHAPDPGRHQQPVRLAGGLPAAVVRRGPRVARRRARDARGGRR